MFRRISSVLTIIQLTFLNDVSRDGPTGPALLAWAHSMSLIARERFWQFTSWGRQSDDLKRVYVLISWRHGLPWSNISPTVLSDITSTNLSYPLLPLLPYLSTSPRINYIVEPRNGFYSCGSLSLDIIYIRVSTGSDLEAFVDNLQFGRWISGPRVSCRSTGDVRSCIRDWAEDDYVASTRTYVIMIKWRSREAADRFKDLTRPSYAYDTTAPDDTWGMEFLALFKELSKRGAATEHVSVDFGRWPFAPPASQRNHLKKSNVSLVRGLRRFFKI